MIWLTTAKCTIWSLLMLSPPDIVILILFDHCDRPLSCSAPVRAKLISGNTQEATLEEVPSPCHPTSSYITIGWWRERPSQISLSSLRRQIWEVLSREGGGSAKSSKVWKLLSQIWGGGVRWPWFFDHLAYVRVSWSNGQKFLTMTMAKISKYPWSNGQNWPFLTMTKISKLPWSNGQNW